MTPKKFSTDQGREIAYHKTEGKGPGVVFLGGFMSDMQGTKAVYLEEWARKNGRAFLRFDYSGHGDSSGEFRDGCIGDWAEDAEAAIGELTKGKQILVGSSMGGWISLLLVKRMRSRIAGMVGVATAPDFTEDSMWESMNHMLRAKLNKEGVVYEPSDYGQPYAITKRLIEDGRDQLVLRSPLRLACPVRLLHGTADTDVGMDRPMKIMDHAEADDIRLTYVKAEDHRFSSPAALKLISDSVEEILRTV